MRYRTNLLTPAFLFLLHAAIAGPTALPPTKRAASTTVVKLSDSTIVGTVQNNIEIFSGIPYAEPPVKNLRLRPPQKKKGSWGTIDATRTVKSCPQLTVSTSLTDDLRAVGDIFRRPPFQANPEQSEDCLTITITRPAGTKTGDKLPVLFWIHGGGFQTGGPGDYNFAGLVSDSVVRGRPIVVVAVAYRLGGFGFLPGKEVLADGASNLGLLDQRLALEWVADNIASFGGDPQKVVLSGESAGAWSVFDQVTLYDGDSVYNGKSLFRGAVLSSGSMLPAERVDSNKAQAVYDHVVQQAGCGKSNNTLECLRSLDYTPFLNACNSLPSIFSYTALALPYLPRPDGVVLTDSPEVLAAAGKYASVPMIFTNQEDEGTVFSLFQQNTTGSTSQLLDYFSQHYYTTADPEKLRSVIESYSSSFIDGSPYRTGLFNELYPGYKRFASILGDLLFTMHRRIFMDLALKVKPEVPNWSLLASYGYGLPFVGTYHGSDLSVIFQGGGDKFFVKVIRSYIFSFVYDLDPNKSTPGEYPALHRWSAQKPQVQVFASSAKLGNDNYRTTSCKRIAASLKSLRQ
ncbi:sterol esterase precursor [Fusarium mexicanum]|uniref:Carboxylic ester hydrolase n=1 Tax=Fusarium mexicanum TaxID=751941 RepID=A0A8H5I4Y7_9HYPO|nr:sterol esterase precursor [Fusarium mexicanum]